MHTAELVVCLALEHAAALLCLALLVRRSARSPRLFDLLRRPLLPFPLLQSQCLKMLAAGLDSERKPARAVFGEIAAASGFTYVLFSALERALVA